MRDNGLRCRLEIYVLPNRSLGHMHSGEGRGKSPKLDAVVSMPTPSDVFAIRFFLGAVCMGNIYGSVHGLRTSSSSQKKKHVLGLEHERAVNFPEVEGKAISDSVLVHFDPLRLIGVSWGASDVTSKPLFSIAIQTEANGLLQPHLRQRPTRYVNIAGFKRR